MKASELLGVVIRTVGFLVILYSLYDFLGGLQEYKTRWSGQVRNYTNIQFTRPRSLGGYYIRTLRFAQAVKDRARLRFPRVWGALRWFRLRTQK